MKWGEKCSNASNKVNAWRAQTISSLAQVSHANGIPQHVFNGNPFAQGAGVLPPQNFYYGNPVAGGVGGSSSLVSFHPSWQSAETSQLERQAMLQGYWISHVANTINASHEQASVQSAAYMSQFGSILQSLLHRQIGAGAGAAVGWGARAGAGAGGAGATVEYIGVEDDAKKEKRRQQKREYAKRAYENGKKL